MGLEEVRNEILENAKKEIKQKEEETKAAIVEIEDGLASDLENMRQQYGEKLREEKQRLEQIGKAESESLVKQMLLDKKWNIIDSVMEKVKRNLIANSSKYVPRLYEKSRKEIDVKEVYCREEDLSLLPNGKVSSSIDGGIICENADGTVSIDYTYDTLLNEIKEKYMGDIGRVLFK